MSFSDRRRDQDGKLKEIGDLVREYMIDYTIDQHLVYSRSLYLSKEDKARYEGRMESANIFIQYFHELEGKKRDT